MSASQCITAGDSQHVNRGTNTARQRICRTSTIVVEEDHGRLRTDRDHIDASQVFAGQIDRQMVGVRQVDDHTWLATFMHDDLGYFDDETCRLEFENPFRTRVLPMSPE